MGIAEDEQKAGGKPFREKKKGTLMGILPNTREKRYR